MQAVPVQDTPSRAPCVGPLRSGVGWIDQPEARAGAADAAATPNARIAVAHTVTVRRVHRRTGSRSWTRFAAPGDFGRFPIMAIWSRSRWRRLLASGFARHRAGALLQDG